ASQKQPADNNWTGAEIRACCRLAALLDLPLEEAAKQIVPVAVTAAEAIEKLRTWASGRCLSSEAGGIFQKGTSAPPRRVKSDPSPNCHPPHPTASHLPLLISEGRAAMRSSFRRTYASTAVR